MFVHAKILKSGDSLALRQRAPTKLPFCEAQLLADLTSEAAHAEIATLTTKEMGE